jgi:G protein-coupled receptor GPR1
MRRSFRQDLIMLLIQSDMMKAFWLMLCPIVYFISGPDGPINTNSAFCQVSGFFLTVAIEASDIAVLMIAIHSALYIFKPQRAGGQNGLYPYRRIAYGLWFVLPIVLAAVVPLSGARFVTTGPFCYLPFAPAWYRVGLSWIPRYIIFGIIFLVYASLYIYVAMRFRRLQEDHRRASTHSTAVTRHLQPPRPFPGHGLPPTPKLLHHGLLDPSPRRNTDREKRGRQQSVQSDVSTLKLDDSSSIPLDAQLDAQLDAHLEQDPEPRPDGRPGERISWHWNFDGATAVHPDGLSSDIASPTAISFSVGGSEIGAPPRVRHASTRQKSVLADRAASSRYGRPFRSAFWRKTADHEETTNSTPSRLSMSYQEEEGRDSMSPSLFVTQADDEDVLQRSRDKMSRQLRLLFIYPVIYILAWIAPFISFVYLFGHDSDSDQPYAITIASIASLCIGAAVDSCFYSAWEKPWRHLKGGFWESLAMRVKLAHNKQAGGRTREEQLRDATTAIDRRNLEIAEHQASAARTRATPAQQPREWWDADNDTTDDEATDE